MLIYIKKLNGGIETEIDVTEQNTVLDAKTQISSKWGIDTSLQKLVFRGKTLSDDSIVGECGLKDGAKMFLAVKKGPAVPSCPLLPELSKLLERHFSQAESQGLVNYIHQDLQKMIEYLSLDDLERLSKCISVP